MKRTIIYVVLMVGLQVVFYYGAKQFAYDLFQEGMSTAHRHYQTCSEADIKDDTFPEYKKACATLCQTLYKDKALCVSSISGGSVTCVCEQTP